MQKESEHLLLSLLRCFIGPLNAIVPLAHLLGVQIVPLLAEGGLSVGVDEELQGPGAPAGRPRMSAATQQLSTVFPVLSVAAVVLVLNHTGPAVADAGLAAAAGETFRTQWRHRHRGSVLHSPGLPEGVSRVQEKARGVFSR